MGRQLRDGVPAHQQHYKVDSHWRGVLRARERESVRQQGVWVERQGATRTLPPLMLGTQLVSRYDWSRGVIRTYESVIVVIAEQQQPLPCVSA
ncbi:hypothetical protein Pcinc_006556 [Petrolisthes cinctipes]|uniref:Uncharacterized protein n=1 Tax=Petrolisthes cinctipes TaxID=88211 RepID=A0AAE1KZ28_PETCI|nr:hypothetical protein Pcinc_006556 [Petrolisthes cinctipes]